MADAASALVGAGMARFSDSTSKRLWLVLKGTVAAAVLTFSALVARHRYRQLRLLWNPPPSVSVTIPAGLHTSVSTPASSDNSGQVSTDDAQVAKPDAAGADTVALEVGARVRLAGLRSKPELNGKLGKIKSFDAAKGRYNVVLEAAGSTLQVKASNMKVAVALPAEMSSQELIQLTLSNHGSLSPAHASRVTELLRSPNSPIEAGGLLRCCTCIKWHVPSTKATKSGAVIKPYVFTDTGSGSGFVLCTDPQRVEGVQRLNPPPAGRVHASQILSGKALFNASTLQGIKFVSLDPEVGGSAEASVFTVLPEPYFQPLSHMSEAVCVEAGMPDITAWCMAGCTLDALSSSAKLACRAFSTHTFFCFNASTDKSGQSILPITATGGAVTPGGEPGLYMLLYTCEMLLEQARPHMQGLGAFKGLPDPPACAVPASDLLESLTAPGARNSGVHINEFVPGISDRYQALGLTTEALKRIFSCSGAQKVKEEGVTV